MGTTSQKALPVKQRRRHGSTSPPLVGIESNPGPHQKKGSRKARKTDFQPLDHNLTNKELQNLETLFEEGLTVQEISRSTGLAEETVTRWHIRYLKTGKLVTRKRSGRPPKRPLQKEKESPSRQRKKSRKAKRRKQMDAEDKGMIKMGLQHNIAQQTIANEVDRNQSTVSRCKTRIREGDTLERKRNPGSGRPRKTTKRDDRHFKLAVVRDTHTFAPQAAAEATSADGEPALASRNVQTRLHEQGLRTKKKVKKPAMTDEQKKNRLAWAREHAKWDDERWASVLWSDESPFTLHPAPYCGRVWVHEGTGLDPRQIEGTKKHGGGHITIWGCFSALGGIGSLKWVKGHMDSSDYHGILTARVFPELRKRSQQQPEVVWLFQQDNASIHTAEQCSTYLKRKEEEEGFKVLDWPSQSPDLNPIENLWAALKTELKKRKTYPTKPDELWEAIQEEWTKLKKSLLDNLAGSMKRRCQLVIAAHGGPIRY